MKQIFIENFRIDVDRCEVHRENDIVSLEPKVLQVFLYLKKHQGEVVSHQALLDEIWPNTVVEANALQRCIGQLRKAFNDDAKQQRVIATYPKNGYSLLSESHSPTPKNNSANQTSKRNFSLATALLLLIIFMVFTFTKPKPNNSYIEDLTNEPLSTNVDFYAIYSPNGQYLVYPRPDEINKQKQQLWLQDLFSNEEFQLTVMPGAYNEVAWSPDSRKIAFVENSCLSESCLNKECSEIKSLEIPEASTTINITKVLIECDGALFQSPQWVNKNTLIYIEKKDNLESLIRFDINIKQKVYQYQKQGIKFQHLSYSPKADTLAISISDTNQQKQILLFFIAENIFTQIDADYPDALLNEDWFPFWNPQQSALILSSSEGLYNIELDGQISKQNSPFIQTRN